jgi:pyruvate carboxylase
MSSLMYPKVFSDYMARLAKLGPLLKLLPTRVYWYAMVAGDACSFDLTKAELAHLLAPASLAAQPAAWSSAADDALFTARMELVRVSAIQRSHRTVALKLQVQQQGQGADAVVYEEVQTVLVKDNSGVFVFEGPMADAAKPMQQVCVLT